MQCEYDSIKQTLESAKLVGVLLTDNPIRVCILKMKNDNVHGEMFYTSTHNGYSNGNETIPFRILKSPVVASGLYRSWITCSTNESTKTLPYIDLRHERIRIFPDFDTIGNLVINIEQIPPNFRWDLIAHLANRPDLSDFRFTNIENFKNVIHLYPHFTIAEAKLFMNQIGRIKYIKFGTINPKFHTKELICENKA